MEQQYTLTITTTIPCLNIRIWDGNNQTVLSENIKDPALIPHFSTNQMDLFSRENSIDLKLNKCIYTMRLSLPYYSLGQLFMMPLVMDEFLIMDKDKEYRFDAALISDEPKREIIRKRTGENFEK